MNIRRKVVLHPGSWRRLSQALALLSALLLTFGPAAQPVTGSPPVAVVLKLTGAVGPATADYIKRGLEHAADRKASLVILQMDTPGGLDSSMREIIRAILASPVPVASFVGPSGARAASAGTYILYASHIAAMAPGTNLGAATPIMIGGSQPDRGMPGDGEKPGEPNADQKQGSQSPETAKAVNDAVAYIRGLAELRNRNADWAERAVREAASLPATAAAREHVIDFIATSPADLLRQAEGRVVHVGQTDVRLDTANLVIEEFEPDWRTQLLSIITDPNIALILMMIGIYGLIFEFLTPGTFVPGTVGAICLLLGLYALALLPVSFAGLALILLGVGLTVAEAHSPSFGALGISGGLALVLGATILFDTNIPGLSVSWSVLGGIALASLAFSIAVAALAFSSRGRKVVTGAEQMIGIAGRVDSWAGNTGYVIARGERWQAVSAEQLTSGDEIRVTDRDGLTLKVTRSSHEI